MSAQPTPPEVVAALILDLVRSPEYAATKSAACPDCDYALDSVDHAQVCAVRCKGDCCERTTGLDSKGYCDDCSGVNKREERDANRWFERNCR